MEIIVTMLIDKKVHRKTFTENEFAKFLENTGATKERLFPASSLWGIYNRGFYCGFASYVEAHA